MMTSETVRFNVKYLKTTNESKQFKCSANIDIVDPPNGKAPLYLVAFMKIFEFETDAKLLSIIEITRIN